MKRIGTLILGLCVFLGACTTSERATIDDLAGESFESMLQALKHAGCPFIVYSEGLPFSAPFQEDAVLEMAHDAPGGWNQFYGEVDRVEEFSPGLWLFVGDDSTVVGGVDEQSYVKAFCEADDERSQAVTS